MFWAPVQPGQSCVGMLSDKILQCPLAQLQLAGNCKRASEHAAPKPALCVGAAGEVSPSLVLLPAAACHLEAAARAEALPPRLERGKARRGC